MQIILHIIRISSDMVVCRESECFLNELSHDASQAEENIKMAFENESCNWGKYKKLWSGNEDFQNDFKKIHLSHKYDQTKDMTRRKSRNILQEKLCFLNNYKIIIMQISVSKYNKWQYILWNKTAYSTEIKHN